MCRVSFFSSFYAHSIYTYCFYAFLDKISCSIFQAVMAHADWIIDLGPGAGHDGGHIVFEGTPHDLVASAATLTGEHLATYVTG